jgi:hypothetical protein
MEFRVSVGPGLYVGLDSQIDLTIIVPASVDVLDLSVRSFPCQIEKCKIVGVIIDAIDSNDAVPV